MEFAELRELQREIASLQSLHVASLEQYYIEESGGFRHKFVEEQPGSSKEFSRSSTATCVLSLTATGRWTEKEPWHCKTRELVRNILEKDRWKSAGLDVGNAFTVSFMLEAALALEKAVPGATDGKENKDAISEAANSLNDNLLTGEQRGAATIKGYPPNTYLTQLVTRVLKSSNLLNPEAEKAAREWGWQQLEHELALSLSERKTADAFALAYALMLFVSLSDNLRPPENQNIRKATDCIFRAQLTDGSWPLSRPLFHYPKLGNAYCFEYEMLTQLLQQELLTEHLLRHLPKLKTSVQYLSENAYRIDSKGRGKGWASGHHPQLSGPESWSTASAYHFLYVLDRLLAEQIRREVFTYVGAEYQSPTLADSDETKFAKGNLDSAVKLSGKTHSLRTVLFSQFVGPIAKHSDNVRNGRELPKEVSISAVFYGPPGTSKTKYAKYIAEFLGWPLLPIDPSHLVRKGLDQIQAETNTLFSMLASLERVVVLLDEFDEMLRERTLSHSEVLSRFLTTAMLPKLAQINDRRRIVFIVATNHINEFDAAIRRPGRFDVVLQIMPPTTDEKLNKWKVIRNRFGDAALHDDDVRRKLSALNFIECLELVHRLENGMIADQNNLDRAKSILEEAHQRCILTQQAQAPQAAATTGADWAAKCDQEAKLMRIPGL